MEELVVKKETMSSLEVAELTGKRHADVMRDIRNLLDQGVHERNFALMFRINKLGNGAERKDPYYNLTKKGCLILASGYDAKLREKIIDRWEELEKEKLKGFVIPGSFSQALMLAAKQQEQIEEQQKQISVMNTEIVEMKKKTDYLEIILNSKETVTITQIAQDYGMTAKSFNRLLEELKIQRKVNGQWILYSPYITQGYVHSKSVPIMHKDGSRDSVLNTEWRQKGRIFLYEKLKKAGVLPLIERN
jgi:Rha family phage regulatory protein